MYNFLNDYSDIGYIEILDNLKEAINEKNPGYGFDKHSENARNLIKKALEDEDVDIHFVSGGTIANIIGVTMGLRGQDSIIAPVSGHIQGHEAGAIEATGHKIELIHTRDGKLSPELLEKKLNKFDSEYVTVPKTVYISNTTEIGTVYSKDELEALYKYCKSKDLYLFIDGARLAAAIGSDSSGGLELSHMTSLCDGFTIGGTKNGLLFGEALVVKNNELRKNLINLIKQKGALMAKGFILGIQFETVFKDKNFFIDNAKHAHIVAEKLYNGLVEKGYKPHEKFYSNQIFFEMSQEEFDTVSKFAKCAVFDKKDDCLIVRFVSSYSNTLEEVEGFLSKI